MIACNAMFSAMLTARLRMWAGDYKTALEVLDQIEYVGEPSKYITGHKAAEYLRSTSNSFVISELRDRVDILFANFSKELADSPLETLRHWLSDEEK